MCCALKSAGGFAQHVSQKGQDVPAGALSCLGRVVLWEKIDDGTYRVKTIPKDFLAVFFAVASSQNCDRQFGRRLLNPFFGREVHFA